MKLLLNRIILRPLISVLICFATIKNVCAQSPLHDSLRNMLIYFNENAKDEKLRQAIKEAQVLYKTDVVDDSLSKKLLVVDSLLIANRLKLDKKAVLSYAEMIVQVLQHLPPPKEHTDYALSLNNLGDLYNAMGQYEKALPLYQQVVSIRAKVLGVEHPDYAASLNNLGILYRKTGQYEKALPLFQQVLSITAKTLGVEHPNHATALYNIGVVYRRTGKYEKALSLYQQVLAIREKVLGIEHPDYATSLNSLGILYKSLGQYEKALPLFQQTLAIHKKIFGVEHPDYATSLNNLATLYEDMGQYEKALPLFQQVLSITAKTVGVEHPDYASSLSNLAILYVNMGQSGKALPLFQQVLAIDKKTVGADHPDYATSLHNLANLYVKMGKYEKALPIYQQVLSIKANALGVEHPNYASSLHSLGNLYVNMGQYAKALPLYQQALSISKSSFGEEHPDYASFLYSLGLLYTSLNDDTKAASLTIQASNSLLRHLRQTYTTLSEQDKMIVLNNQSYQFSYLPSLLFINHTHDSLLPTHLYANELAVKGMVLDDQQQVLNAIRKSSDSTTLQVFEQWRLNKTLIGTQLLLPVARRVTNLDSLQEATTLLEQQLSRQAASFRNLQQSQVITPKEISQKLLTGEAAVEFIQFNLYNKKWTDNTIYAALILLPGDTTARFVPLFEEKQLQRLLKPSASATNVYAQYASIEKLYGGTKPASSALQHSLYQLLWKPLEKHLAGIHTVYYAPAGLLHRISFQALRSDATHLLIDQFRLQQVLSTRSVVLPSITTQEKSSVGIWGNINYHIYSPLFTNTTASKLSPSIAEADTTSSSFNFYASDTRGMRGGDWGSLPGGKKEIDTLATLFNHAGIATTIDSGTVATEEAFKALSGKSPQVLHLATHGFFLPVTEKKPKPGDDVGGSTFTMQQNPMFRSGLVLAGGSHAWKGDPAIPGREDGILTAYEIAQMDLSSTDLVVLSACETALGDLQGNEGVIGLQRAFKLAGVKQLVMSLWRVPDEQTNKLMTLFYQNRISGQANREALRNAQLKMKEKYPPYYWAAFVLVE